MAAIALASPSVQVVVVGSVGVGKSCLVRRLVSGVPASAGSIVTLGADSLSYMQSVPRRQGSTQSIRAHLRLSDTAGEETFHSLTPHFLRRAQVVLLCFDARDALLLPARDPKASMVECASLWGRLISEHCPPEALVVLVGCKGDLLEEDGEWSEDARETLEVLGELFGDRVVGEEVGGGGGGGGGEGVRVFVTSAETGEGVEELFDVVGRIGLAQSTHVAYGVEDDEDWDAMLEADDPESPGAVRLGKGRGKGGAEDADEGCCW